MGGFLADFPQEQVLVAGNPSTGKHQTTRLGVSTILESRSFELCLLGVRRTIAKSTWAEIRTAYASGIGLREIARNMAAAL